MCENKNTGRGKKIIRKIFEGFTYILTIYKVVKEIIGKGA